MYLEDKWTSSHDVYLWEQQMRISACASARSDQCLCYSIFRLYNVFSSYYKERKKFRVRSLTFTTIWASRWQIGDNFLIFLQKTGFDIFMQIDSSGDTCNLHKMSNLFSGKNKKNISKCLLFKPRVLSHKNFYIPWKKYRGVKFPWNLLALMV